MDYKQILTSQGFTCDVVPDLYDFKFSAVKGLREIICIIDGMNYRSMIESGKDAENDVWKQIWLEINSKQKNTL